ncbi:MAG: suppressor of fused domain protein, partial [Acidobacteriota bacterium]
ADRTVHFHALVPLHQDEVDLKLEKGAEALFDGFDRDGVSELLDPGRPSSVHKKRFFGLW